MLLISQMKCLPLLAKSYMGFNNFWSSGQDILTKFTIQTNLLQPFIVIGGLSFWIASSLLLKGFTHPSVFYKDGNTHVLQFCLEKLTLLWRYFQSILCSAFNKSFNLAKWDVFVGVNNNKSSMIASQYFLLCKQTKTALMYDCHITGEIFKPHSHPLIHVQWTTKIWENSTKLFGIFCQSKWVKSILQI